MAKIIPLKRQRIKPKYKYALNEQVAALPRSQTIEDLVKHLEDSGISRNEFYNDRKIQFGSQKSIPADRLLIYAQVFSCALEDLLNQQVKAKAFREQNAKRYKSPLA